jgi:hypothetical protein
MEVVMLYCEKCYRLSDDEKCANCGFTPLREVNSNDFCYLITAKEGFGKSLIEVFKNEGIECAVIPVGDGVRSKLALTLGSYQLFVPYLKLEKAREIVDSFIGDNSTDKLREIILNNIDKWHFESGKIENKIRKKLNLSKESDLILSIKEIVKTAHTINDAGLMLNREHGLVVKTDEIILWFSSESFEITV